MIAEFMVGLLEHFLPFYLSERYFPQAYNWNFFSFDYSFLDFKFSHLSTVEMMVVTFLILNECKYKQEKGWVNKETRIEKWKVNTFFFKFNSLPVTINPRDMLPIYIAISWNN